MHMDVLARALVRRAPAALGRRICARAVMKPMMEELRAMIPENGAVIPANGHNEEISERRATLQYLESTCRLCAYTAKCWPHGVTPG